MYAQYAGRGTPQRQFTFDRVRLPGLKSPFHRQAARFLFGVDDMRKQGSCRFETYYKVQFKDALSCAWKDIQKAHPTESAARAAFIAGQECRVMEISEKGRKPL